VPKGNWNFEFVVEDDAAHAQWLRFVSGHATALALVLKPISTQDPATGNVTTDAHESRGILELSHRPVLPPICIHELLH
jgi:hypothetical protein